MLKSTQSGIAPIQVLLISAIITVFVIYITKTAKNQLAIASMLVDRNHALVSIHDAESVALFNLLTKTPMFENESAGSNISPDTFIYPYYFGQLISLNDNSKVYIQDHSGRISAIFPNRFILKKLLTAANYSQSVADTVIDSLLDWQDINNRKRFNGAESSDYDQGARDLKIPFLEDIERIKGVTPDIYSLLRQNMTEVPAGFNPIVTSEFLLKALYPNAANEIITLREKAQITATLFRQLTDTQDDDDLSLFPSNIMRIKIESNIGTVLLTKSIDVKLRIYAQAEVPVKLLAIKWNTD